MDETMTNNQFHEPEQPMQSVDEIMQIITEATIPAAGANLNQYLTGSLDVDDDMEDDQESDPDLDVDSSGEIIYAMWLSEFAEVFFLKKSVDYYALTIAKSLPVMLNIITLCKTSRI